MATRKQKAAARRNIKKAQAARRKHKGKGRKHARRRTHHKKSRRSHRGGHIPLKILERRLKKLSTIVHKRRGR